jgi:hypothetical protein
MAMKPIAVFVLVAVISLATVAASAKTVTMPAKNPDEQSVNAVAGPPPAKKVADAEKEQDQNPAADARPQLVQRSVS